MSNLNKFKVEYTKQLDDEQINSLSQEQFLLYSYYLSDGVYTNQEYEFAVDGPYHYKDSKYSYLWIIKHGPDGFRLKFGSNGKVVW